MSMPHILLFNLDTSERYSFMLSSKFDVNGRVVGLYNKPWHRSSGIESGMGDARGVWLTVHRSNFGGNAAKQRKNYVGKNEVSLIRTWTILILNLISFGTAFRTRNTPSTTPSGLNILVRHYLWKQIYHTRARG